MQGLKVTWFGIKCESLLETIRDFKIKIVYFFFSISHNERNFVTITIKKETKC